MQQVSVASPRTERTPAPIKLNLGCGHVQPAGWVNADASNRAWLASRLPWIDRLLVTVGLFPPTEFNAQTVYTNLAQRFPWRTNSVAAIYMGEVLEHFTRTGGEHLLRECQRVLAPGGVLRLRVPDHAHFWQNYVSAYQQTKQLPRSAWTLEHTRWTDMFFRDICVRHRPLRSMGHFHKWMYDDISLIKALEAAGFQDVERMPYHQSRIADIAVVEVRNDLIVEGVKPPVTAQASVCPPERSALPQFPVEILQSSAARGRERGLTVDATDLDPATMARVSTTKHAHPESVPDAP